MNILEIIELEQPAQEFDIADEREQAQAEAEAAKSEDDLTSNAAKKAFRSMLHKFRKTTGQSTKKSVQSTWIAGLDYDHNSNVCTMRLSDGRNYEVKRLEPDVYYSWAKAPSKGKFFHKHIKNNYYI